MWLQQRLRLLPSGLHLESVLHDFQVVVAAYVICESYLRQAENCTHNVLEIKSPTVFLQCSPSFCM